jgi:hypothetical protein
VTVPTSHRAPLRAGLTWVWLVSLTATVDVHAGPRARLEASSSARDASEAAPRTAIALPSDAALPPLPKLTLTTAPPSDPEATKEVASLIARLTSDKADIRDAARDALTGVSPSALGAVVQRLDELRESMDRERAYALLEDARRAGRDAKKGKGRERSKRSSKDEPDESPNDSSPAAASAQDETAAQDDWLRFVHARPAPRDEAWRELVELLGLVRMLGAIGSTPAVRRMIELRAQFGDLLRLDLSRQVAKLGERAVPALIEARAHDATVVQRFASVELDRLGKVTPGEAVGVSNPDVLADTLRAFGSVREVDATDVLIGFANHDRRKLREAAREAIGAIGEAGRWRLRDAYLDLTGEKPERSTSWEILARRLFFLYDKARDVELEQLLSKGSALASAGDHSAAVRAFDSILARDPLSDGRGRMAPSYAANARSIPDERARLAMLRKARLLDPKVEGRAAIDAEIAFLEAKLMHGEGRPERFLLARALEADPQHAAARALQGELDAREKANATPAPSRTRAGVAAAVTLSVLAVLELARRKARTATASNA